MEKFNLDDKIAVVICCTILGIVSALTVTDPTNIIMNIITGLCGIAVGQAAKPSP